jgi:prepilin-type processing-associated H-X9-DG protein
MLFNGSAQGYLHPNGSGPLVTGTNSFFGGGIPGTAGAPCLLGPWYSIDGGWMNESLFPNGCAFANGAGGPHVGGGQILMADGSVRWLSANVSANVWTGINTRSAGEILGEF